jgi:2'-5' RNA ligase
MRAVLAAAAAELRPLARDVSWVAPDNLHLTLKFLGSVDEARVPALVEALAAAAAGQAPYDLVLRGLGAFPSATRPRVLWAGAADGAERTADLAARVDAVLAELGVPREARAYTAHVTLGRVRVPRAQPALARALAAERGRELGRLRVERLTLMRSDPGRSGARYTALADVPLGGGRTVSTSGH